MTPKKNPFNFKVFTSFLMSISFVVLLISGIVLFIAPPGRVANWTNWTILGFSKTDWINFHLVFMLLFIVAGIFHLFWFNWKPFLSYLKSRSAAGLRFKKELIWCAALSLVLLIGMPLGAPPMIWLADLSEAVTESWEEEAARAPVSHAELLTLEEYAQTIGLTADRVLSTLEQNGLTVVGPDQVMEELAAANDMAPSEIDRFFKQDDGRYDSGVKPAGAGLGKMELSELIQELNLTMTQARARLEKAGVAEVREDWTLKRIAEANDRAPRELMDILAPGIQH
jgi:hypothetical protein